ncbi:methylation-associated defense system protein MAD4 [Allochromatium tepidum]|uniref:DUF4276 family protein n=1 Tax=Allochromatium tepidum TaxID=553982 RepID=A0ABN6G8E7_9GAMM|nr:hypothetical protein [Allochromatium tepidum]BCU06240.1 hypothetical protein Atep_09170 [Allochromatium tepidum]
MKDLLVYVADADALAFLRSILNKHQALGICAISFDIERHPQRDAGMVQSGAELARMKKNLYGKVILMWDHHGSGRDHKQNSIQVAGEIQNKLDAYTWSGNSAVTVLVPELEQWLWHCENAVAAHCNVTTAQLEEWVAQRAQKLNISAETLKRNQPKELFEYVMREKLKRTISPRDFEEIGSRAGITKLLACDSFRSIYDALRHWFPPDMQELGE